MARRGAAAAAIVAVVIVVLAGAAVVGYVYVLPSTQHSSTTTQTPPSSTSTSRGAFPFIAAQSGIKISNAALSNNSLLVTVQNTGSQNVSLDALVVTPGTGCSLAGFANRTSTSQTSQSSQTNRTRTFSLPTCFARAVTFVVQSNSTLKPLALGQFNFTTRFNSSLFNFTGRTFSGSANFSRTFSGNFTRAFANFTSAFPIGLLFNLSSGAGLQLAPGQSITLAYTGAIGSSVTSGSEYTIVVAGPQGEGQITLPAS